MTKGRLAGCFRYVGFAVVAFVGGMSANLLTQTPAATAADPPGFAKRVVAENFVVVDGKGKPRILLSVNKNSPFVSLCDGKGQMQLNLGVDAEGAPSVTLFGRKERPRLFLSVSAGGGTSIQFFPSTGRLPEMVLSTQAVDKVPDVSTLRIFLPSGKPGAVLGVVPGVGGGLHLFDKDGKKAWSAP